MTVNLVKNGNLLIHSFLLSNLLYVAYLGYTSPNESRLARRVEYFNEAGLQLITYHLALFPVAPTL